MRGFIVFSLILSSYWAAAQQVQIDTLTRLNNLKGDKAVYKAPNGKFYKVEFMKETTPKAESEAGIVPNCVDSTFAGSARKAAKTSFAVAKIEDYLTVTALLKTLPKDAIIRPKVNSNSKRITEETRNVRLNTNTYLFAFKKEADNDYHVIIGDNVDPKKATFFNAEISGLPKPLNKVFQTIRTSFEKRFVDVCSDRYIVFSSNPIKIQIEGSIFFDVDHLPGQIGPTGFQPNTTWEIHPISKITFLK